MVDELTKEQRQANSATHKTRYSDSSLYDEVCTVCGARDYSSGPDEIGDAPCRYVLRAQYDELLLKWDNWEIVQDRLIELTTKNPPAEAIERLLSHVDTTTRLTEMDPKGLVDLALDHLSANCSSMYYELIVEELCTRVHPEWCKEDPG